MLNRSKASKLPKMTETLDHADFESAIKDVNVQKVKELISKGHKLCSECWGTHLGSKKFELVKILLKHDNSFINQPIKSSAISDRNTTVLMAFCPRRDYRDMQFMINQGADVTALDQDGKNIMFFAVGKVINRVQLFRTLINAGADPHVRDNNGYTLLHWAIYSVESYDVGLLKYLIEEIGIDPLVKSNDNTSVLSAAISMYFRAVTKNDKKIRYKAMRYLFDLAHHFQNGSNDPSSQVALLSNLHKAYEIKAFDFFFNNPQFMNRELIERSELKLFDLSHQYYNFGPVGIFLNHAGAEDSSKINKFLNKISSRGFSIIDPPNCFSPLVILVMKISDGGDKQFFRFVTTSESATYSKNHNDIKYINSNKTLQLVKKFVESGAYAGQRMMQQRFKDHEDLTQLAEQILLPDVFFALLVLDFTNSRRWNLHRSVSFLNLCYLLPHLAAPPLALALFANKLWHSSYLPVLLPILFEFGPVPPGTRSLTMLRRFFETLAHSSDEEPFCQAFEEMHSSPPSLLHLCRSQIRMSVAAHMPRDCRGPNLPDLISTFTKIPPPLITYLQMWPQEPLNVVICDNQEIADRANRNRYRSVYF